MNKEELFEPLPEQFWLKVIEQFNTLEADDNETTEYVDGYNYAIDTAINIIEYCIDENNLEPYAIIDACEENILVYDDKCNNDDYCIGVDYGQSDIINIIKKMVKEYFYKRS